MPLEAFVWLLCAFGMVATFLFGVWLGNGLRRGDGVKPHERDSAPKEADETEEERRERELRIIRDREAREAFETLRSYGPDVAYGMRDVDIGNIYGGNK